MPGRSSLNTACLFCCQVAHFRLVSPADCFWEALVRETVTYIQRRPYTLRYVRINFQSLLFT